jgi:hypothetical protein
VESDLTKNWHGKLTASQTSDGVEPNSPSAIADVQNEQVGYHSLWQPSPMGSLGLFFSILDVHCENLKAVPGGGVGWFWHIYSDGELSNHLVTMSWAH